jgi:hypothetical protein
VPMVGTVDTLFYDGGDRGTQSNVVVSHFFGTIATPARPDSRSRGQPLVFVFGRAGIHRTETTSMADAPDSKSSLRKGCGFESHLR